MRVLVTWASKRGGTEGIARDVGETLRYAGFDVELLPADAAGRATGFDAAIVGGALYAGRWPQAARRFVRRQKEKLRSVPVWFFSSGPLDETADHRSIAPVRTVQSLMDSVGAQGHVTFGGRLAPNARGFPASAMARTHAGDWRNLERIRAWATEVAHDLPTARPRATVVPPGGSVWRVALHALFGWAFCAVTMGLLLAVASPQTALVVHALATPFIFALVAQHYFRAAGACEPLSTATAFVLIVALLDLIVVAGLMQHSTEMFRSIMGSWLPFVLLFFVTWVTGEVRLVLPGPAHGR